MQLVEAVGGVMGRQLRICGVNLNFAPVLDVDTNPDNPVIGSRSFGTDPQVVGQLGRALAAGLQGQGVAACGKHFPGHGDTEVDSHLALPRLRHDRARLERVELRPFRAAIADASHVAENVDKTTENGGEARVRNGGRLASVMTAHVVFEALGETRPATMSRAVVSGLLRAELGFDGVVISDDLEMKAIADHYAIGEVAVSAIDAGVDLLLCCHRLELIDQAVEAVIDAVGDGRLDAARVEAASRRVEAMANRYAVDPAQIGRGWPAVRAAEADIALQVAAAIGGGAAGDGSATAAVPAQEQRDPTDFLGRVGGKV